MEVTVAVFSAILVGFWYLYREIRKSREEVTRLMEHQTTQLEQRLSENNSQIRSDMANGLNQLATETKEQFGEVKAEFAKTHGDIERLRSDTAGSIKDLAAENKQEFAKIHEDITELRNESTESRVTLRHLCVAIAELKQITLANYRQTQQQFEKVGEDLARTRERVARLEGTEIRALPAAPSEAV